LNLINDKGEENETLRTGISMFFGAEYVSDKNNHIIFSSVELLRCIALATDLILDFTYLTAMNGFRASLTIGARYKSIISFYCFFFQPIYWGTVLFFELYFVFVCLYL
jgi:hypothetical protein